MKQETKNNVEAGSGFLYRLVADKKKSVAAAFLGIMMIFMWMRVFASKIWGGVETSQASEASVETDSKDLNRITFVELPNVEGGDNLARDFFAIGPRGLGGGRRVEVVSDSDGKGHIQRITKKLNLETIVLGTMPQVFINGKLLGEDDVLLVKDGSDRYKCQIVEIRAKSVLVRCGDEKITLKLTHSVEDGALKKGS